MKAIIAQNNLGFIGLNGTLPWRCKADLMHFKQLTEGCTLLVGYNTLIDLPPLKDRTIIPAPRDGDYGGIYLEEIDWCIGGKKTYESMCHLFTELHISHIDDNTIGDTMMPNWSNLNPDCQIFNYYFSK